MRTYHVPKSNHTNPDPRGKVPEIHIGKIISTVCGLTIKVMSHPHSISSRDTQLENDTFACPTCGQSLPSNSYRLAYLGEEIPRQNQALENQATA